MRGGILFILFILILLRVGHSIYKSYTLERKFPKWECDSTDYLDEPDFITKTIDKNGYERQDGKLVHRVVAFHSLYNKFYPLRFREYQVHHKDGNKLNNRASNLQILTREEHKEVHGIR